MRRLDRVGQTAGVLHGVGGQFGEVFFLHLEITQTGGNADFAGHFLDGLDADGRALGVAQALYINAHGFGHVLQAAGRSLAVEALYVRQQYRIAHAVWQVVETAELVRHGVHVAEGGVVEGHAGQQRA